MIFCLYFFQEVLKRPYQYKSAFIYISAFMNAPWYICDFSIPIQKLRAAFLNAPGNKCDFLIQIHMLKEKMRSLITKLKWRNFESWFQF